MSQQTEPSFSDVIDELQSELADPDAPRIGVHTIGQFAYCPRAGLLSAEAEDDMEMERPPSLGGLPQHDVDRMQQALSDLAERIKYPTAINIGLAVVALWLWMTWGWVLATPLFLPMYYSLRWLVSLLQAYHLLQKRLSQAAAAASVEPNWDVDVPQPVNWWSLLRVGFDSIEKQTLEDFQLRIAGKPWRVLHRGDVEIPVLRIQVEEHRLQQYRNGRLRKHHLARIGAYSYLLNRCERADSSWALLLFNWSDEGIAVPLTPIVWETFKEALTTAREHLHEFGRNINHAPDPNVSACGACPLGAPRKSNGPTDVRKRGLAILPFGTENSDGTVYHSQCGDYFRWLTPHQSNRDVGLPS